jgi:hypothetical protein
MGDDKSRYRKIYGWRLYIHQIFSFVLFFAIIFIQILFYKMHIGQPKSPGMLFLEGILESEVCVADQRIVTGRYI